MQPICQFILSYYATGQSLRRICRGGVLLQYCEENRIEIIDYFQVKAWLTNPHFDEDYKEFRKQYAIIQKRMIPILIDELREDAEELQNTRVTGKYDVDRTDPRKWDGFRARFAVLKFLQSHHRTPKHTTPASQARKIAAKQSPPAQNPSNLNPEGQIVNRTSQIVNELSSLPGIGLNLPKITLTQAEEILGSPILNDQVINIAQDFSVAESCAERIKEVYNFPELDPKESAQSASFSAPICEKQNFANLHVNFAELCEKPGLQSAFDNIYLTTEGSNPQSAILKESANSTESLQFAEADEIVNRKSKIVNPHALCQNSAPPQTQTPPQTPTIFRQIPNFHSRLKPNPG